MWFLSSLSPLQRQGPLLFSLNPQNEQENRSRIRRELCSQRCRGRHLQDSGCPHRAREAPRPKPRRDAQERSPHRALQGSRGLHPPRIEDRGIPPVLEGQLGKLHSLFPHPSTQLCLQGQSQGGLQDEKDRLLRRQVFQEHCLRGCGRRHVPILCLFA